MRQCEIKRKYDPEMDMHVGKHVYGEGITDIFKSVGKKIFGKTAKSIAKTAAKKAATTAATTAAKKTGEYAGKKAGDKIVELLSKEKKPTMERQIPSMKTISTAVEKAPSIVLKPNERKELSPQEIAERVNQMISGGKLRRRNFI